MRKMIVITDASVRGAAREPAHSCRLSLSMRPYAKFVQRPFAGMPIGISPVPL